MQLTTRQAILRVSVPLLLELLPEGGPSLGSFDGQIRHSEYFDAVAKALRLPDNAKVTGVSAHLAFDRDQVAVRIECPDFVESPVDCPLPEVEAWYLGDGNERRFSHWNGPVIIWNSERKLPADEAPPAAPKPPRGGWF